MLKDQIHNEDILNNTNIYNENECQVNYALKLDFDMSLVMKVLPNYTTLI